MDLGAALPIPAIELNKVSLAFGGEEILRDVSFHVNDGETVVLVGPSGQGKSSLLKAMAGLTLPSKGEVLIRGIDLSISPGAIRQGLICEMGMLFQKNALFDSLTCGDNIAFPLREVTRRNEEDIEKIVTQFLEAVGISHAKNLYPDEISGGMQKRLGIARALALDPEILFYDDPTAGLDPITSKNIIRLILDLKKQKGSTVIAVTNDMNRAYQMADRIIMVVDKSIIITGNKEETLAHPDPRVKQFVRGELQGPLTVIG